MSPVKPSEPDAAFALLAADLFREAGVDVSTSKGWLQFVRRGAAPSVVRGKYLFFSQSVAQLALVVWRCLVDGDFVRACISPPPKAPFGDRLLCLFWSDSGRDAELHNRFRPMVGLAFRGWKHDGEVSQRRVLIPKRYVRRSRGNPYRS